MFAVVKIGGKQYKVAKNDKLKVDKMTEGKGKAVDFDKILLVSDGKKVQIGTPYIKGNVSAKVLSHGKDKKITASKIKPKKRYSKTYGHRQAYTELEITDIKA